MTVSATIAIGGVSRIPSYYRARYYNPNTGRFLSEDPFGFGGGINLYAYTANSPTNWSDPFGYAPGDKWFGKNNRDFQDWFHRNWKQPGDPDAGPDDMNDAYNAWKESGSPQRNPKGNRRCHEPENQGENVAEEIEEEAAEALEMTAILLLGVLLLEELAAMSLVLVLI